jgi:hypothetical protein
MLNVLPKTVFAVYTLLSNNILFCRSRIRRVILGVQDSHILYSVKKYFFFQREIYLFPATDGLTDLPTTVMENLRSVGSIHS